MKEIIKKLLLKLGASEPIMGMFPANLQYAISNMKRILENKKYKKYKSTPPPNGVKQTIVRGYQKSSGINILVETGTFFGDMLIAQFRRFEKLYSIELSDYFYNKAVQRFRKIDNVYLFHGDSSTVLQNVLSDIHQPVLFWLDGHYSGGNTAKGDKECPIWEELNAIVRRKQCDIILIDDARLFTGEGDYPTLEEIKIYFQNLLIPFDWEVKDDIIRITIQI
jgi:hypothetical protein